MLKDLDLPTLQQRRKELRLTFLFKIAEGLVPAIPSDRYLTPIKNKRNIKGNPKYKDYVHDNKVEKYKTTNTRPFKIPESRNSQQYIHSLFKQFVTGTDWTIPL